MQEEDQGLWQQRNESFADIETEPMEGTTRGRSATRKGESPAKSTTRKGNKSSMIEKEKMQLEKIK